MKLPAATIPRFLTAGALALAALATLTVACEGSDTPNGTGGAGGTGGGGTGGGTQPGAARCAAGRMVECTDQAIAALSLKREVNPAVVTNASTAGVFESRVDASAGGIAPTTSFVYLRFTDQGLEKLAIHDEQAFDSLDWDIALRRYIIRINGGSSGPSCVDAAMTGVQNLEDVKMADATLGYETDVFLSAPACAVASDGTGLGGPITAIASYFDYPKSCLVMTNEVFLVRLRDSRTVALQVQAYYKDDVQLFCNTNSTLPGGGSGAGQFRLAWKFLPAAAK